jgi:predicted RNA-binding protein with PUA domain
MGVDEHVPVVRVLSVTKEEMGRLLRVRGHSCKVCNRLPEESSLGEVLVSGNMVYYCILYYPIWVVYETVAFCRPDG